MKQKIVLLLIAMCSFLNSNAQKEQHNWLFGNRAGLTWNTTQAYIGKDHVTGVPKILYNIPTRIPNSPIYTNEGCFSLSDVDGNLLFFSDGMTIWNRNMNIMQNGTGMTGNSSSAQSGIILPYPSSTSSNRYVAVSLGERSEDDLSYSIIDMTLDGGLGGVEAANKNIRLIGQTGTLGESVTAVRNTNKQDFWIMAVGRGSTTHTYFNVWKVSEAGGIQVARHSVASLEIPSIDDADHATGYIKFSQDGRYFIWASMVPRRIVFGSFDPSTGIASNLKYKNMVRDTNDEGNPYGVEFSPNGKYIYVSMSATSFSQTVSRTSKLYCFSLQDFISTANLDLVAPVKSFTLGPYLANGTGNLFSGIQMGPDNRLYSTSYFNNDMIVLEDPDEPLTTGVCILEDLLESGDGRYGLPSFAAPWFKIIINTPADKQSCSETLGLYTLSFENGMGFNAVSKITIDFGDGGSSALKTIINPDVTDAYNYTYTYKTPGTYTVTATAYNSANVEEISQTSTMTITSCVLKVNKHIRGVNK